MCLVSCLGLKPKTPRVKALGVLLFGVQALCVVKAAAGDCVPAGLGELVLVERVYDGDTVKLKDGRQVRLLGVNTPEIEHGKERPGQALGEESRMATEAFLKTDKQIRLFYDVQRVDRYGRTLAHIYDAKNNSLAAYLLRKGLGFHVAIPPNLSLNDCLSGQEKLARKKALGVWRNADWQALPAAQLQLADTGFKRIRGRVVTVRQAQSVWLELDGPVAIKITPTDLNNFDVKDWSAWQGRQIEVRGWVTSLSARKEPSRKARSSVKASYKPLLVQPRIAENLELLSQ